MSFSMTGITVISLLLLLVLLSVMMCCQIHSCSKENVERMTQLDIYVYKKMLRGISICFGLTYAVLMVILLLIAYHSIME